MWARLPCIWLANLRHLGRSHRGTAIRFVHAVCYTRIDTLGTAVHYTYVCSEASPPRGILRLWAVAAEHVGHGYLILLGVGVTITLAGEVNGWALRRVEVMEPRAHSRLGRATLRSALFRHFWSKKERQPRDSNLCGCTAGSNGAVQSHLAHPAPRSEEVAQDLHGHLLFRHLFRQLPCAL